MVKMGLGKGIKRVGFGAKFSHGILFGIRSYDEEDQISFVGYIPLIDFCITFYKG